MRNFLILIILSQSFSSVAQNHLIGVKGGISWSDIHSKEISTDANRTGFTVGFSYENRIRQNIIIGGDLLYQQRGFQMYFVFTDDYGNSSSSSSDNTKFYYDYVAIPVKAGYIVGNKLSGFLNIGLVPSYLIKAKTILPEIFIENTVDVTEYPQKVDLAGLIEFGGNLKISERLIISASFTYQHSFTTYSNPDYFEDLDARHYGLVLTGGIKYALKSE